MINIERIFQIHPYCVGMVWGGRFRPLFLFKYRVVAKMINIERLGWILNVFFKSTLTVLVWCGVVGFGPCFCSNIAGWLKWSILNAWGGFWTYFPIHPYCVGMVWGDRFRPLFLFQYRRVAKMINIERLGWILNVFFKSTLSALVRGGWIVIHLEPRQNTLGRLRWPILNVRDRFRTFF